MNELPFVVWNDTGGGSHLKAFGLVSNSFLKSPKSNHYWPSSNRNHNNNLFVRVDYRFDDYFLLSYYTVRCFQSLDSLLMWRNRDSNRQGRGVDFLAGILLRGDVYRFLVKKLKVYYYFLIFFYILESYTCFSSFNFCNAIIVCARGGALGQKRQCFVAFTLTYSLS